MDRSTWLGGRGVPGLAAAGATLGLLVLFYLATGALTPNDLPEGSDPPRRILGMALMLIVMPPYLMAAWTLAQRRSLELVDEIRRSLPDPAIATEASERIRNAFAANWRFGLPAGLVLGLVNNFEPLGLLRASSIPVMDSAILLGQFLIWGLIGLFLSVRLSAARAFRRLGEVVPFHLLSLDSIRPLAQSGIVDVAFIAGALLLSPLQSLDAEFRWGNYNFALLIATPATAFFLIWPLLPLYQRIRNDKRSQLADLNDRIATSNGRNATLEGDDLVRLESLLAHRDRVRDTQTWPHDLRILSRVLLYLVIPPLAWAGAAIVERFVEQAIGS